MSNLETVKTMYEAFGRDDVPTILSHLAEEVDWELWEDNSAQQHDVPYMRYRKGAANVGEFFQEVAKIGLTDFRVLSLMEGANQVAAEIKIAAPNFSEEEIHLWTFNENGKVSRFRHYLDTAKHIAAIEESRRSTAA